MLKNKKSALKILKHINVKKCKKTVLKIIVLKNKCPYRV